MAFFTSFWMTFAACVLLCAASPTRRQFVSIQTETTSSDPAVVTNEWDDTDDFDLDGEEDWLSEAAVSPSTVPLQSEYEDYGDDDDESTGRRSNNVVADVGDQDEDDDLEHQDAGEDNVYNDQHDAEFLFLPSRDNRLMLQDDDEQSGPIKVRHTGKNSYTEDLDMTPSKGQKVGDSSQQQFEFTIDDDKESEVDSSDKDDFVLEDTKDSSDSNDVEPAPDRRESPDEDDDDEDFVASEDGGDDSVFASPEEDSQVIYGDHVFLY